MRKGCLHLFYTLLLLFSLLANIGYCDSVSGAFSHSPTHIRSNFARLASESDWVKLLASALRVTQFCDHMCEGATTEYDTPAINTDQSGWQWQVDDYSVLSSSTIGTPQWLSTFWNYSFHPSDVGHQLIFKPILAGMGFAPTEHPVPEPITFVLFGVGLSAIGFLRPWRKN